MSNCHRVGNALHSFTHRQVFADVFADVFLWSVCIERRTNQFEKHKKLKKLFYKGRDTFMEYVGNIDYSFVPAV